MSQYSQPPIFPSPSAPDVVPPPPPPAASLRQRNLRTAAIAIVATIILIAAYSSFPGTIAKEARAAFPNVKAVITGVTDGQVVHDGGTVTLSATSSSGKSLTYDWSFSDGTTAHTLTVTHTYHYSQGTFYSIRNNEVQVSLTVTDPLKSSVSGHENTTTLSFIVYPQPPTGLGFTYAVQSYSYYSGSYVTFIPTYTDPDPNDITIKWDLGDGSTDESYGTNNETHYYNSPGSYTVKMTVADSVNQTATYSQTIQVSAASS